jgi:hypothetical protein
VVIVGLRFKDGGLPCGHPRAAHYGLHEELTGVVRWYCRGCQDAGMPWHQPRIAGYDHGFSAGTPARNPRPTRRSKIGKPQRVEEEE